MRTRLRIAMVWIVVVAGYGAAAADDAAPPTAAEALTTARELFDDLEYGEAIESARAALADPEATSQQQLEALEIAGLSHLIRGEEGEARRAFEELLGIDPDYELREETGSPRIRDFFETVRETVRRQAQGSTFAELVHAAPASARSGAIAELEVAAGSGAGEIVEMVAMWRGRDNGGFQEAAFRRREHDRWAAGVLLPASKHRWVLEYYVEARDLAGRAIGRVGGPNAPLAIPVEPGGVKTSRTPWYRRWYVIGAGAAVLGAGVAVGIAAGSGSAQGTLEPGTITLTP